RCNVGGRLLRVVLTENQQVRVASMQDGRLDDRSIGHAPFGVKAGLSGRSVKARIGVLEVLVASCFERANPSAFAMKKDWPGQFLTHRVSADQVGAIPASQF